MLLSAQHNYYRALGVEQEESEGTMKKVQFKQVISTPRKRKRTFSAYSSSSRASTSSIRPGVTVCAKNSHRGVVATE
jgi:hypothetical protein